jgi:hypothetical protein
MRKKYEMSEDDLKLLLKAIGDSQNTPLIALHCGMPPSPQEAANRAWSALAEKMKFDFMSVEPTGEGDRFFTAVSTEEISS